MYLYFEVATKERALRMALIQTPSQSTIHLLYN